MEFFRSIGSPRFVCAPMVDQSELAFRMLTRRYGVELAYTPMLHSRLFSENAKYRKQQFTTCAEDRPLFAQFCGDDPDTLVRAARHIESQVDAVDLNCGCPQGIARKGHYGALLLSEGDLICEIVRRWDQHLDVPGCVKMRKINCTGEDPQETVRLAQQFEQAGASLLTVHGRTKEEKGHSVGAVDWSTVAAVKAHVNIPVLANGGIETWADVERCMQETRCDGVMSAEGLLENPSLFYGQHVPQDKLIRRYLELTEKYPEDQIMKMAKKHMYQFLHGELSIATELRPKLGQSKSLDEIRAVATEIAERRAQENLPERG